MSHFLSRRTRSSFRPRLERLETRDVPATLPAGFAETAVASGLSSATAMELSPDGKLFVAEQGGTLEVWNNGTRVAENFLAGTPVTAAVVDERGERGLLGVAFDPDFATNRFVYVYYTVDGRPTSSASFNRVSRFTANAAGTGVASGTTETVIFALDNLTGATNHNGGALHFGPDGKLYVAVGDNATGSNAQTLANLHGKMLRLNADGSIPSDNPFFGTASGKNRAIWALGLRNPFTFSFSASGRMFINDVGQNTWEEINEGGAGRNFNWPGTEGNFTPPNPNPNGLTPPVYAYPHSGGAVSGFAITGGAFYDPATNAFPAAYSGDYFFADFVSNWIKRLDTATGTVSDFASGAGNPVDLRVAADGDLLYLSRGEGKVYRVTYSASSAPTITTPPQDATVTAGQQATFTVVATGEALSYRWQRNRQDIPGATAATYSLTATAADDGARFRVIVTNSAGSATSSEATLTVTTNAAPVATIVTPSSGSTFRAGVPVNFSGTGTDAEDGTLPAGSFTWKVDYVTSIDSGTPVVRPFVPETSGATSGTFTPADRSAYTLPDVAYRVTLKVTDSQGRTHTVTRDVLPEVATVTLRANVAGLRLTLDGQPYAAPYTFRGVVGLIRPVGAATTQVPGGVRYEFASWSDGGAATHEIATPAGGATLTATYVQPPAFQQKLADGLVAVEAEAFHGDFARAAGDWTYLASGAMRALPDRGTNIDADVASLSPRLDFRVNFVRTGVHYVWVRGNAVSGQTGTSDSLHVGLDGVAVTTANRVTGFGATAGWSRATMDGPVATVNVTTPGVHTVNVWMREDGFTFDRFVLTTSATYTPTGTGPAGSGRAGPAMTFVASAVNAYGGTNDGANGFASSAAVPDNGATLGLSGNAWKAVALSYTVTASTVLEFEFRVTDGAEINAVGLEEAGTDGNPARAFQLAGSTTWGGTVQRYRTYSGNGWRRYAIPVGEFYTGEMAKLFFVNDEDATGAAASAFRNVRVYEA